MFFRPLPLLMQFRVPRVLVIGGRNVTTRSGVPIPVPGAAHIVASFKHPIAKACFAQFV